VRLVLVVLVSVLPRFLLSDNAVFCGCYVIRLIKQLVHVVIVVA
jgi:hypothetical protein